MALPKLHSPNQTTKWRKYLWLLVSGIMVAVGGVAIGLFWNGGSNDVQQLTGGRQLIIESIELGALVRDADPTALNPVMQPKMSYALEDQLVLRITTAPEIIEPVTINARLLTINGVIVELDPPTFTLQPGVSSFCCWQIEEEGEYTLQLFRPEKVVTSLPVIMRDVTQSRKEPF